MLPRHSLSCIIWVLVAGNYPKPSTLRPHMIVSSSLKMLVLSRSFRSVHIFAPHKGASWKPHNGRLGEVPHVQFLWDPVTTCQKDEGFITLHSVLHHVLFLGNHFIDIWCWVPKNGMSIAAQVTIDLWHVKKASHFHARSFARLGLHREGWTPQCETRTFQTKIEIKIKINRLINIRLIH